MESEIRYKLSVAIRMLPDKRERPRLAGQRQRKWAIYKGVKYIFVFNENSYPGVIKEMFSAIELLSNQKSEAIIELLPISPIGTYLKHGDKFEIIVEDLVVGKGLIQRVDYSVHPI